MEDVPLIDALNQRPVRGGDVAPVAGDFVDREGERFYRITHYDAMPPFLMTLVSDSDHWLFISSNGSLTAGRRDPDRALFPYYPDDRIHDGHDQTGSKTLLRVARDGRTDLWEPFFDRGAGTFRITRTLFKSVHGNRLCFEETNQDLALTFSYEWMNSDRFGFVRRATLTNHSEGSVLIELLDGIQNVLPDGLGRRFQLEYSTLGDGYKRTERIPESSLALFRLSSIPVDKAEPSEALRVNLAWSTGLSLSRLLLSSGQIGAFRRGEPIQDERDIRGRRGAYLMQSNLALDPAGTISWLLVAEVHQDAAQVCALRKVLTTGVDLCAEVMADVARGTRNLVRTVARADGLQATGDEPSHWRHFSNTLFNTMRGGLPADGYCVSVCDFRAFLEKSNRPVAEAHAIRLGDLPDELPHQELVAWAARQGDWDLERLAREYLPFTFSRRHGDPSRPWNTFSIQVKDDRGAPRLNYEGNWRDIFQNWEALAHAYPGYLEGMIFKFLDSSTLDGHNPYRVMREGYEWETIDPHDPWSFIGYWGDHQVVYLLKLLEASERFHPGALTGLMQRRIFTFANVPYRIKPYAELLADPRHTVDFDAEAHRAAMGLAAQLGADGKALHGANGLVRSTLAEKLLLVALTKLTNFIPEAGIWMNTQRPEWNDANNALVGFGVSVVTLCYLRRYLSFCKGLFEPHAGTSLDLAPEIRRLLDELRKAFEQRLDQLGRPISAQDRKQLLDSLGLAGSAFRAKVYARGLTLPPVATTIDEIVDFIGLALTHVDETIRSNRRPDGLYHAYNLMKLIGEGIEIRRLPEMLEGQVAVLSSGLLSPEESADLLDALRASALYREDQASYLLYPDRELPGFLERNLLPPERVAQSALLSALLAVGDDRLVVRDAEGNCHFNADFRNADGLNSALAALQGTAFEELAKVEGRALLDLYEQVFDHQSFTGRSGAFYKYEGLGCIYWHMVSKLLVALDELLRTASASPVTQRLKAHYHEIREGLGVHKNPAHYGAIPTDPYSHTPSFAGAQQPGMTGQVKEDFLTRFGELGLWVQGGCITFQSGRLSPSDFLGQARNFQFFDAWGEARELRLEAGTIAFTHCQVPVVLHPEGGPRIELHGGDGTIHDIQGLSLDAATSASIFQRTGKVLRLEVFLDS